MSHERASKLIDQLLIQRFLELCQEKLQGEWLLMGSSVLVALNSTSRYTEDIDFVNLDFKNDSMPIWDIAAELGLRIEQINQAGGFFLSKIANFRADCIVYRKNKRVTIYLPNAYLFFQLKLGRFSDTDTQDCVDYLALTNDKLQSTKLDCERLRNIVHDSKGTKTNKKIILDHLSKIEASKK